MFVPLLWLNIHYSHYITDWSIYVRYRKALLLFYWESFFYDSLCLCFSVHVTSVQPLFSFRLNSHELLFSVNFLMSYVFSLHLWLHFYGFLILRLFFVSFPIILIFNASSTPLVLVYAMIYLMGDLLWSLTLLYIFLIGSLCTWVKCFIISVFFFHTPPHDRSLSFNIPRGMELFNVMAFNSLEYFDKPAYSVYYWILTLYFKISSVWRSIFDRLYCIVISIVADS